MHDRAGFAWDDHLLFEPDHAAQPVDSRRSFAIPQARNDGARHGNLTHLVSHRLAGLSTGRAAYRPVDRPAKRWRFTNHAARKRRIQRESRSVEGFSPTPRRMIE